MTQKSGTAQKPSAQDKAERTTLAAASIMDEERRASDAKVARLRAMRLARESDAPAVAAATKADGPVARRPVKRAAASTIRKLALQADGPRSKPKGR